MAFCIRILYKAIVAKLKVIAVIKKQKRPDSKESGRFNFYNDLISRKQLLLHSAT